MTIATKPELVIERLMIPAEYQPYHNRFNVEVKFKGIKPLLTITVDLEHGMYSYQRKVRVSMKDDYKNRDFKVTTELTGIGQLHGLKDRVMQTVADYRAAFKPTDTNVEDMATGVMDAKFSFEVKDSTSGAMTFVGVMYGPWEFEGSVQVFKDGDGVGVPVHGSYYLTDKLTQEQIKAHNFGRPSFHEQAKLDIVNFIKPVAKRLWNKSQADRHAKAIEETERNIDNEKDRLERALHDEKKARKELSKQESILAELKAKG